VPLVSNYHAGSLSELLESALSAAGEELLVVAPDAETLEGLVAVASEAAGPLPTVRVLAAERTLKRVVDDFLVASAVADLVADGTLALRHGDTDTADGLLVSGDAVTAVVAAGDRVAGLSTDEPAFVEAALAEFRGRWETGEEFGLRTPPLSRVRETLAADVGETVLADFDAVLDHLRAVDGDDGLDEVTISLLVAARNDVLLYDISKWGEDVGIASKATFSRTKTRLEEVDLVDTEKVPIDVGRPRLRLKLGPAAPTGDLAALVDAARDRLA
jgi:hypothetical protein